MCETTRLSINPRGQQQKAFLLILTNIIASLDAVQPLSFGTNEIDRLEIRAAARRLLARVETPNERAWGFCFENPIIFAALQTCIELDLWKSWTALGGGEMSVDELVELTTPIVETNLLRRFLRLLAAFNVIEEIGPDKYKSTPFSYAIGDESSEIRATLQAGTNQYLPCAKNLPTYLSHTSYKEPTNMHENNHADTDPDGLNFFARLQQTPAYFEAFIGHMEAWTAWKTPWTKIYDTTHLLEGANLQDDSVFMVDMGGNTGIDTFHVLRKLPELPKDSVVLQDLPEIVAGVKGQLDEKVVVMEHDFFLPQLVRGSRIYFMHAVLHDWPDDKARKILMNTKDAMKKGYSKLLIYDIVLPPMKASMSQTTMDVQMMSLLAASERTEADWRRLITDAGLRICGFWPDPKQYEMVIEVEVA
ncbi:S-adenosyl-L-methionine-dependent methyltransferase [Aspergillus sclerotioniger CBS 115572]|uniref:S-adenosyl-L-methionine-dependent methyltransferase n=1 Tax=Aspergillus sclerotioniger CBS 115572 TaxID=1450535 RepID=A0A317WEZ9_9EURO|nr:S-adenosyl-L-methionine-dependent methyltransferase [Aspergillus sclerotioniger CBS 115572]PWY83807.1 S-adenosyl-L-methionine-dependent methyltransferase [Aspergillus sclerotioniger CBS 115572]